MNICMNIKPRTRVCILEDIFISELTFVAFNVAIRFRRVSLFKYLLTSWVDGSRFCSLYCFLQVSFWQRFFIPIDKFVNISFDVSIFVGGIYGSKFGWTLKNLIKYFIEEIYPLSVLFNNAFTSLILEFFYWLRGCLVILGGIRMVILH